MTGRHEDLPVAGGSADAPAPEGRRDAPASPGRRWVLRAGAAGAGAVAVGWSAPRIISVPAASAQTVVHFLEIDPNTCEAVTTTEPQIAGCRPDTTWGAGLAPPDDLDWEITERHNGTDCTNGFTLELLTPGCTIREPRAEELCVDASPPAENCVDGVLSDGDTVVTFPDNSADPLNCSYIGFRMLVECTGS